MEHPHTGRWLMLPVPSRTHSQRATECDSVISETTGAILPMVVNGDPRLVVRLPCYVCARVATIVIVVVGRRSAQLKICVI